MPWYSWDPGTSAQAAYAGSYYPTISLRFTNVCLSLSLTGGNTDSIDAVRLHVIDVRGSDEARISGFESGATLGFADSLATSPFVGSTGASESVIDVGIVSRLDLHPATKVDSVGFV